MVTTPQEPVSQPDSLVHAQLAPDRKDTVPGEREWLTIVVDNHDRRSRAVQLQLGGPMSRFCRPRLSTIDMLPGEQREVRIQVGPQATMPEGGYDYELSVTATDLADGAFLDRSTARIAVAPRAALRGRPTGREQTVDNVPATVRLVVHNGGNVQLRAEVFSIEPAWWVRTTNRRRSRVEQRTREIRSGITSVVSSRPLSAGTIRPGEHWNVPVPTVAPRYLIGLGPRRWLVPIAVGAAGRAPECVFAELDQAPRVLVAQRAAAFAGVVAATFLLLLIFMIWLAM